MMKDSNCMKTTVQFMENYTKLKTVNFNEHIKLVGLFLAKLSELFVKHWKYIIRMTNIIVVLKDFQERNQFLKLVVGHKNMRQISHIRFHTVREHLLSLERRIAFICCGIRQAKTVENTLLIFRQQMSIMAIYFSKI